MGLLNCRAPFGAETATGTSAAWRDGHRRLYEHLCATTKDKPDATLEDLQPLYQAVAHGCQAGLQQEVCDGVYYVRITRGDEKYAVRKLGAFGSDLGAVACFFEQTWSRVSPVLTEADQAWLLNQAAFRLRALGRLTEALEPMRAGLEMRVKQEVWKSAAIIASNLSELELTLGEVAGAVGDAEQSVTYADRSGDPFWKMGTRTTHADALHQAGRRAEAEARFREAEQMQAENQPEYPLLYSLQGFRYCDLLLTEAERAAWQRQGAATFLSPTLTARSAQSPVGASALPATLPEVSAAPQQPPTATGMSPLLESCRAVSERGATMFEWRLPSDPLLDIALDHLTLGRAALYAAILAPSPFRNRPETKQATALAKAELDSAVDGLRHAGQQQYLPPGLLTRAWLRRLTDARTDPASSPQASSASAQSDLEEAWEIAERGPMPLFMADVHLYRARLFGMTNDEGRTAKYPWESPQHDLAEARRLIVKHGYLRRMGELEDAEAAARV